MNDLRLGAAMRSTQTVACTKNVFYVPATRQRIAEKCLVLWLRKAKRSRGSDLWTRS